MQEAQLPPGGVSAAARIRVTGSRQSHSSVGQSATLIMWRSAVQLCLGLRGIFGD